MQPSQSTPSVVAGTSPRRALPVRPLVRRWARALVRELAPLLAPRPARGGRLLAIFIDGLPRRVLARAGPSGTMRFLPRLRDGAAMREARTFSGMPSSTVPFQAGLFYGLRTPDIPAFHWLDRATLSDRRMNVPSEAAAIEATLQGRAEGPALLEGGAGYLTSLRGGAPGHFSTAGAAPLLAGAEGAWPAVRELPAQALVHGETALAIALRLVTELGPFLWSSARFTLGTRSLRHEGTFLASHLLLGTLGKEAAQGELLLDLVRGLPRLFVNLSEYDEAAHRRGPEAAERVLRRLDLSVEMICAVAEACADPPDVWIFTDHGQLASVPFQRLFGCSLADWLLGVRDGAGPAPQVPKAILEALGRPGPCPGAERVLAPRIVPGGNYAHVYLARGAPLDGAGLARSHGPLLARALDCPGVGLVALRTASGPAAFIGARRVDPALPGSVPRGASPRAVAALLAELASSPSAGDLVLYGAWHPGGCVSFSDEHSSHGGPSPEETETFVLHPAHVPHEVGRVAHGADLNALFRELYP